MVKTPFFAQDQDCAITAEYIYHEDRNNQFTPVSVEENNAV
jgi:hypothetical protein